MVRTSILWGQKTMTARVRCAVYTRKSPEEGLGQSFNSLDGQREACEAYILSQRHVGWHVVSTRYDDGGFSLTAYRGYQTANKSFTSSGRFRGRLHNSRGRWGFGGDADYGEGLVDEGVGAVLLSPAG